MTELVVTGDAAARRQRRVVLRRAGVLLTLGGSLFTASALATAGDFYTADTERQEYLEIARHASNFRWTNLGFLLATVIATVGFVLLARVLHRGKDRRLVDAATVAMVAGTVVWTIETLDRATVVIAEADKVARGAPVPAVSPHLLGSAGAAVEGVGTVVWSLAILAIAAFAWAARRERLIPAWLAWLPVLPCVAAVVLHIPPFPYLFAVLPIGVALLLHSRHTTPQASAPEDT
jgi:hypothetical protein